MTPLQKVKYRNFLNCIIKLCKVIGMMWDVIKTQNNLFIQIFLIIVHLKYNLFFITFYIMCQIHSMFVLSVLFYDGWQCTKFAILFFFMSLSIGHLYLEVRHLVPSIELLYKNVFIKLAFINLAFHHLLQMSSEVIKRQVAKTRKKTDSDYNKRIFFIFLGGLCSTHQIPFRSKW